MPGVLKACRAGVFGALTGVVGEGRIWTGRFMAFFTGEKADDGSGRPGACGVA